MDYTSRSELLPGERAFPVLSIAGIRTLFYQSNPYDYPGDQSPLGPNFQCRLHSQPSGTYRPGLSMVGRRTPVFSGLHHQSLSLYGGFQHMSHKERNYSNKILYPRGITLPGYEIASLRTGYHMPIAFPDLPLSSLLYLKTINAAVFYDWGSSRNKFGKATYSSYGIELTTDTHFFRLTYPIRLGIRTGYETQHKKMFADLIFSIGLSI